jgi:ATP-dependent HslUV protease ATP-binding subunit HslU
VERLLEEISFSAADMAIGDQSTITIDKAFVKKQLSELVQDEDLSRYIL